MLNLIRRFLRPTLREQLEDGVREALKRYADRRSAPDLRVYVSTDLLPDRVEPSLWGRDEAEHLRRFSSQWAQDHGIVRAGLRVDVILLDTKREFAFVKPLGLEAAGEPDDDRGGAGRRLVTEDAGSDQASRKGAGAVAVLDVVSSPTRQEPVRIEAEAIVGRRSQNEVLGLDDRYMSARHARLHVDSGRLWVTDLDSKNRTYVNDQPLDPHQARELMTGDTVRMGTTVLRVSRVG
jgi:hypothetical protein